MPFIQNLDNLITANLAIGRTTGLNNFFLLITNFGGWLTITLILLIIGAWLAYKKRWVLIVIFYSSTIVTLILSTLIKILTNRQRPPLELAIYQESSQAFTSTHAAIAIAVYGFLIHLSRRFIYFKPLQILINSFLLALIILIGFSRIYLGVHWFSDVIGGYVLGGLALIVALRLDNRKTSK